MPHITVEYSANLEKDVDIRALIHAVHQAALTAGVFAVGAVRTRAERRDVYEIADGDPDNAFIHVDLNIASGRNVDDRKRVADSILNVVRDSTRDVFARTGLAISVEVREIDNTAAVRLNNLHARVAKSASGKAAS